MLLMSLASLPNTPSLCTYYLETMKGNSAVSLERAVGGEGRGAYLRLNRNSSLFLRPFVALGHERRGLLCEIYSASDI